MEMRLCLYNPWAVYQLVKPKDTGSSKSFCLGKKLSILEKKSKEIKSFHHFNIKCSFMSFHYK